MCEQGTLAGRQGSCADERDPAGKVKMCQISKYWEKIFGKILSVQVASEIFQTEWILPHRLMLVVVHLYFELHIQPNLNGSISNRMLANFWREITSEEFGGTSGLSAVSPQTPRAPQDTGQSAVAHCNHGVMVMVMATVIEEVMVHRWWKWKFPYSLYTVHFILYSIQYFTMMMIVIMTMTITMAMAMATLTCRSLRTSMSLTGRQTVVLQNITCVFS